MKTCITCQRSSNVVEFYRLKSGKLDCYCNSCRKTKNREWRLSHLQTEREKERIWRNNNKEKRDLYSRKNQLKEYGITIEQYNNLLVKQENKCAICKRDKSSFHKSLCVDHDHLCCSKKNSSCGKCIRGLLCQDCNILLGSAHDNKEILKEAITYLETSRA